MSDTIEDIKLREGKSRSLSAKREICLTSSQLTGQLTTALGGHWPPNLPIHQTSRGVLMLRRRDTKNILKSTKTCKWLFEANCSQVYLNKTIFFLRQSWLGLIWDFLVYCETCLCSYSHHHSKPGHKSLKYLKQFTPFRQHLSYYPLPAPYFSCGAQGSAFTCLHCPTTATWNISPDF